MILRAGLKFNPSFYWLRGWRRHSLACSVEKEGVRRLEEARRTARNLSPSGRNKRLRDAYPRRRKGSERLRKAVSKKIKVPM